MGLARWCALLALLLAPSLSLADEFKTEAGYLRVSAKGRSYRLEALFIKRADLTGKLPIALMTHGMMSSPAQRLDQHADSMDSQARDFAWRGYLTVVVMRRGFGSSDGPLASPTACPVTDYTGRFDADADDLEGALTAVGKRPDADADSAIAIGVSAGGPAVIALGARNPHGLKGVVSVSGGLVSLACPNDDALVTAYKAFGAKIRIPQLWLYAKNDSLFGPGLVGRLRDASLDGGADVKLISFKSMGRDGHDIFATSEGRLAWLAEADGFLRAQRLPTWDYAQVGKLIKTLRLKETDRAFIEGYMTAPAMKAMARSKSGASRRFYFNAMDEDGLREAAIKACTLDANDPCEVVMEDDKVVAPWVRPEPPKAPAVAAVEPPSNIMEASSKAIAPATGAVQAVLPPAP
jgi:dienelactone hydrolase